MYTAKQYIAELTFYSLATTTLNVFFLWFMISHPGRWMVPLAAWACFLSVVPQIIISWRALCIFPECRLNWRYFGTRAYLRKLSVFAGWQFGGMLCGMLRVNGMSVVINKFFGAKMNAAQALGNTVQGYCTTLAAAMQGAFTPAITQAYGAGEYDKMRAFAIRSCKFNVLLTLIFAIPLALELPEVMRLWLKHPPAFAVGLCYCMMLYHLVSCCTTGHMVVVNATGKIALYHVVLCSINILTLPLAVVAGFLTRNVYCVVGVQITLEAINSIGRVLFARHLAGMSVWAWVKQVVIPGGVAIAVCGAIGWLPHLWLGASFGRICLTTVLSECLFAPLFWFVLLSSDERAFLTAKFGPKLAKYFGRRACASAS